MEFLHLNKGILLNSDRVSLEQKFTTTKKAKIHESSPSRLADSSMLDQLVSGFDPPRELYRHTIHAKTSHGTQEESIHWAKRKDIRTLTGGVGIVGHVSPSTPVLEGNCGTELEIDTGII